MEMTQILPELRKLKRVEKLYIMQFLVSELAQEESELIQPGVSYPIWSPYDAIDAATTMLKVLGESQTESYAKDWQQLGLSSCEKEWDNEEDAIYDNWRTHYDVPAR